MSTGPEDILEAHACIKEFLQEVRVCFPEVQLEDVQHVEEELELRLSERTTLPELGAYLWTQAPPVSTGNQDICSYINHAIREDCGHLLELAVPLVHLMSRLLASEGRQQAVPWPMGRRTYRGTTMPSRHVDFFQPGLQYCAGMFLTSSSEKAVALGAAAKNMNAERRPVLFVIDFDPLCSTVSYLGGKGARAGEKQFLLSPYSTLQVLDVKPAADGFMHAIHVRALPDGDEADLDLPVSLWH